MLVAQKHWHWLVSALYAFHAIRLALGAGEAIVLSLMGVSYYAPRFSHGYHGKSKTPCQRGLSPCPRWQKLVVVGDE